MGPRAGLHANLRRRATVRRIRLPSADPQLHLEFYFHAAAAARPVAVWSDVGHGLPLQPRRAEPTNLLRVR